MVIEKRGSRVLVFSKERILIMSSRMIYSKNLFVGGAVNLWLRRGEGRVRFCLSGVAYSVRLSNWFY